MDDPGRLPSGATRSLLPDRARSPAHRRQPREFRKVLSRRQSGLLAELARDENATAFAFLHAVFVALLSRWRRDGEISIRVSGGEPVDHSSILSCRVEPRDSFRSLLARSRECLSDARPAASPGHEDSCPCFQYETPADAPVPLDADLRLRVIDADGEFVLAWEYDAALFAPHTIETLADSCTVLLDALPDCMDRPVSHIELLREEDRLAVLDEAGAGTPYPRDMDIASLVAEQVAARPDAVAIEHGDRTLRYAELDLGAARVARALRARGAKPGDRIGVCMERSAELVTALLGILKLGGVYVPFDADAPEARLAHIARDTGMTLALGDGRSPLPPGVTGLDIRDCLARGEAAPLPRPPGGEHPAYIVYTSGSSGTPKGVVVPHRGVVRLVRNTNYARLDAETVMAQASNVAFDAATFEIWGALCNGGRLVVLDREQILDPPAFAAVVRAHGVTTGFLTTAVFNRFARELPDSFSGFRHLLFGGEQASIDAVRRVFDAGPPERLSNVYGPTENSVFSTWCDLAPERVAAAAAIPIGRSIAHSRCYVVNEALRLQPDGAVGELVVAGDGLALGYWNRAALTAECFVESPASWGKRVRLYRTGDLVRRLPGGDIEYLGRLDNQVKLRGLRIEPGEIEQALRAHPAVSAAAVRVLGDPRQESSHLVAYWVAHATAQAGADELHEHLASRLPAWMLPAAYVSLPELPLTPNGKLDYRALPEPGAAAYLRADYEAPREGTETTLAAFWQTLLRQENIGRKDSFIALGGNSLQLARLLGEIRARFGVQLPFRVAYAARTIARFAELIEEHRDTGSVLPPLERGEAGAALPLSHAQEALLFTDRLAGGDAGYNLFYAFRLRGPLNVDALRGAFQRVVSRHETLRTVFPATAAGADRQHVLGEVEFLLAEETLHVPGGMSVENAVADIAGTESLTPFDLSTDLPLRARLLRIAADDRVLMLTLHHIAADGWSLAILLDEISACYAAAQRDPLPPLPLQYADYARWHRALLAGENRETDIAWWRRQLANLPVTHQLPRDAGPGRERHQGGLFRSRLDRDTVRRLQDLAVREDATLFMALQAAFAVLLSRFSGETDIVMGTPVANRDDNRLDALIGYFVNTVVLRSDLGGNPCFRDLLARNRGMVLDAFDHQRLPFELLVEALNPERDPDSTPLFQVMFVLQNNDTGELRLPAVEIEALPRNAVVAKFDLTLSATPDSRGIALEWEYRADRFTMATIERFADAYRLLLEDLLADPEKPVQSLRVLSDADRRQLVALSQTPLPAVPDERMNVLFERMARRQPDAIAVRWRNQAVTFRELDERAERLADFLHADGIARNELLGLCLHRTPEFLVAVLAAWKAGAAYVPLDPELPTARHEYIVNDAGIRRVLTEAALSSRFAAGDRHVIPLDDDDVRETIAKAPRRERSRALKSDDLAYAIYTSGSTGEPKGVLVEHRAASRLLAAPETLGYDARTVMLQSVNVAFDASVLETWAPLCCGGRIVLCPGQGLDVSALDGLIAEYGINTLTLPAALLDLWVEQLDGPTNLSCIVVGGEALNAATVERLYRVDDRVTVFNHYGPTENGILTTCYRIPRKLSAPVPIGYPAPGTQLYVLNEAGQLQPPGVVGELHVAGQGVARGYLGRPQLTAERFREHAIGASGDTRMYRTGDLVRWQQPGNGRARLQFVGRRDQQVKIRGFRIEPGEVEAQLGACEGVQDARVVVRRAEHGGKELVAYVIADSDANREQWRARLQRNLPAYMVPAAFVHVAAWPLTRNGKLDTKALPAPQRDAYTQAAFAAAATDTEKRLLALWRELLKRDRISIDDSFFDLGGHSLLATRLHNRIRTEFATDLPLRAMFEAQTIRQQAARLANTETGTARALPKPQPRSSGAGDAPLSHAQQRMWFIQRLEGDSAQYHIPWRVTLRGTLDVEALRAALGDIVRRHAILHTAFRESNGEPRLVELPFSEFELPLHDLVDLGAPERTAAAQRCLQEEMQRPFDLANDVTLRACLVRMSATEHWLALTVHHIVADGWAMDVLARELAALYAAHCANEFPSLPPLELQYADYASWQREWLDGNALEPHFRFWEETLRGLPLVHQLPLDRPRPPVQGERGALHRQLMPADLVERLQSLVKQRGATLFMGLHSAFALLLARFSGETDIVVGTPVANRRDESLASLIGLFINTLVFRSDLSGNPGFIELLEASRNYALDAYEHQDLPFELLVERLNPERNSSHGPLFQVLFALQNNETAALELPGLEIGAIPFTERYAKFDLALNLVPGESGLLAEWEYNADLFDATSIERMARAYVVLLENLLDAPHAPVFSVPLLDDDERMHVLALGNDTARNYPGDECLHEVIERQVRRTPDAIAVICEGDVLTYAELNRRANRLARHLRWLGAGPDIPVGIAMERGPGLIVGLLAILKSGGVYVPMDPDYPRARLAAVLADSRPAIVLSDGSARGAVTNACAELAERPLVLDFGDADAWAREDDTDLAREDSGVTAAHGAYITYTSGSTGRPKGVLNEHRGILNRLHWMQEAYPLGEGDCFLQTAAVAFGASVVETFWPLASGVPLVLLPGEGHKDPACLADTIRAAKVTALHFVPSMLHAFLDHPLARECHGLKRIFCGGEAMSGALARRCREVLPHAGLHHLYGCSETAVLATSWDCTAGILPDNIPIGRPGANTRIHILDAYGEPVPRGVRGEIHIAGRQVARGYLHRDDLTAERFLPDPFSMDAGARMYRTGDLGRQLADGSIEHLGRNDFQVKIRGQRVELGDIEAHLLEHAGIRQAAVLATESARDDDEGETRLAAYVVADCAEADKDALIDSLRHHVQARLPSHMQPFAYVVMAAFPLNANGKLDRDALPRPQMQAVSENAAPPENVLQRELVEAWQELLRRKDLGIDDDFFAAGGHSLLVLRLGNRVRETFGYELDLKEFFAAPTIRALAVCIERHRQAQRAAERFHEFDADEVVEF